MGIDREELQMLREATARIVREATAGGIRPQRDISDATWRTAVDSGLTSLLLAEADGGLGGGAAELCALAEELGRGLQAGSFILNDVLAAQWLTAAPASAARSALLGELASGGRTLAVADHEPGQRGAPSAPRLTARRGKAGWVIDGCKDNIWVGATSRELLLTAAAPERGGELLLRVPIKAATAAAEFVTVDGGMALHCQFTAVELDDGALVAAPEPAIAALRTAGWDLALLAVAAECLGMMQALLQRTAAYLAERRQFGQPLSKFQVLRHRLADMALAIFRAEALVTHAVGHWASLEPAMRTTLVAATVAKALQGARFVAEQAVQLHGGMGVSAEVPVGLYLKRLLALEATLGGPEFHRARFAACRTAA